MERTYILDTGESLCQWKEVLDRERKNSVAVKNAEFMKTIGVNLERFSVTLIGSHLKKWISWDFFLIFESISECWDFFITP